MRRNDPHSASNNGEPRTENAVAPYAAFFVVTKERLRRNEGKKNSPPPVPFPSPILLLAHSICFVLCFLHAFSQCFLLHHRVTRVEVSACRNSARAFRRYRVYDPRERQDRGGVLAERGTGRFLPLVSAVADLIPVRLFCGQCRPCRDYRFHDDASRRSVNYFTSFLAHILSNNRGALSPPLSI